MAGPYIGPWVQMLILKSLGMLASVGTCIPAFPADLLHCFSLSGWKRMWKKGNLALLLSLDDLWKAFGSFIDFFEVHTDAKDASFSIIVRTNPGLFTTSCLTELLNPVSAMSFQNKYLNCLFFFSFIGSFYGSYAEFKLDVLSSILQSVHTGRTSSTCRRKNNRALWS